MAEEYRDRDLPNPFMEERVKNILKDLEKQNEVKVGHNYLVRIPDIAGRTLLWKKDNNTYVAYIYRQWYDREKKQNRNQKTIIGQCVDLIPGAMVTNENYYKYFDRLTGRLWEEEREEEDIKDEEEKGWLRSMEAETEDKGEEGDDPVNSSMGKAIRNVLEREGMIPRAEGQWMRKEEDYGDPDETGKRKKPQDQDGEEENEEDGGEDEDEDEDALREEWKRKKRIRILLDLLTSVRSVVKVQARKQPDGIINRFQARKINRILEEIREMVEGRGLDDLMELIGEPRETEREGKVTTEGMSYSDAEMVLEFYNSVIWFTQAELKS